MPIKSHLKNMAPYVPPLDGRDAATHNLLDFNERTTPTSQFIIDAIKAYLDSDKVQQYPAYGNLVKKLAQYTGVDENSVMITNGSDQGIDLVFRAFSFGGSEAIVPGPSFAMYTQCAGVESMRLHEPEYDKNGGYPLEDVLSLINSNTAVVVVANPNNPCGTLVSRADILRIATAAPKAAILVDECYYEYSKATVVANIEQYQNIIVTRTFSKTWGMPSLRFGYLIAEPETINALCNVRGPYDVNQVAVVAAQAALGAPHEVESYVNEVMQRAKPMFEAWLTEHRIPFWQSSANYIWVFPNKPEALNSYLRDNGILVRPKAYKGQLGLRVTIGTVDQMLVLQTIFSRWLKS